ncbi:S100 calcium binding protein U [Stigmatopora nigra]
MPGTRPFHLSVGGKVGREAKRKKENHGRDFSSCTSLASCVDSKRASFAATWVKTTQKEIHNNTFFAPIFTLGPTFYERGVMEDAIQTVVKVFLKSGKGKDTLGAKDFENMVKSQLSNVLTDTVNKEAVQNMRKGLDSDKDGKVGFEEYMVLVGYLANSVSEQRCRSNDGQPAQNAAADNAPPKNQENQEVKPEAEAAEKETKAEEEKKPAGVTVAGMKVTSSGVEVVAPSLDVTVPSLDVTAPSLDVTAPSLDVTAPSLDVTAPSLDVTAPSLDVTSPSVDVTSAIVNVTPPAVEVTAAEAAKEESAEAAAEKTANAVEEEVEKKAEESAAS